MSISANTLFHFTRDYNTLMAILQTKFYPRLCLEHKLLPQFDIGLAIPMVCFCDIPLSQISEHSAKYGKYAIGIKKEWAIQQGVTPVLYFHENSLIPLTLLSEMKEVAAKVNDQKGDGNEKMMRLVDAVCMMKPYKGIDVRLGREVRFYDEREWRYVPRRKQNSQFCYLIEDLFKQEETRRKIDTINESFGLEFNPDVINYLIVEREDEILDLKQNVERIKGNFAHSSVELLSTRIISMERIQEDM